ncbi:hypothetical protein F5882DRAFT_401411 [Hyaloscypha sp. PMI_1271]|nr:hypothetical protein F5882DRAFT_401411 [Hyaloscypha sp. PMI_1271]
MASSSSPTVIAGRAKQMQRKEIPALNTTQPSSGPSVPHKIDYLEKRVQEEANYQVQWGRWMSDGQQKSFYKHVSVLLLSWHPDCDDMEVDPEVQRLKNVFEGIYNYSVESIQLDCRTAATPQAQANLAVANFVHHNDKEDTLFIVYYAGHGSPGKGRGQFNITGRRRQKGKRLAQQFTHIAWDLVENNLKSTRADVFQIFDCCHSSDLGRDSVLNSRSFEYLAASTTPYTRSPGKSSFTSALIWALEKLAHQSQREDSQGSPMFTTSKLAKKISECPDFPEEQNPSLTTRDVEAWQHIILAPLPREGVSVLTPAPNSGDEDENEDEDEEDEDDKPVQQFLSLTFHFKHKEDESELLKKLADHLKKFMKLEPSLHKVQWGGIWGESQPPPGQRWREAVRKVMSKSPVSSFPSNLVQSDSLSPQTGHLLPSSSTERTPLLSDASSVTFEEGHTTQSLWSRISSCFRIFRKPNLAEPQGQPASTVSNPGGKDSKTWTRRLADKLRNLFYRPLLWM